MATWPKGAHYYDGPGREKNSDNPKVTDMVRSVTYQSVAFGLAAMQGYRVTMDDELTAVSLDEHGAFFGVFDGHRGGGGG